MKITVSKEDIKKAVYFIANLTQMQGGRPMQGALSSKGDYMGGIFDRWINIVPEALIFNKIIVPKLSTKKKISIITDYYDYNPKEVGIAPDVIGIRVEGTAIPFVVFNNRWVPVEDKPQIEVKTFKKNQKMVSLRNQNYDNKYLILAETDFRVDYLVPLINSEYFSDEVYDELHMDDEVFIVANDEEKIQQARRVDTSNAGIGTVDLLRITSADNFMKFATKCDAKVSIEYFAGVEEYTGTREICTDLGLLSDYGKINETGFFVFDDRWYSYTNNKGKSYRNSLTGKTIDVYVSNPRDIKVLKILKSKIVIRANKECIWEDFNLKKNHVYEIKTTVLDRGAGEEYFMMKSSIQYLNDCEAELISHIENCIDEK